MRNQHALATLVCGSNVLHNSAPFTLARSAVEAAATALWLLQPTNSWRERVRRLVVYQRQDRYAYEIVAKLVQERLGGDLPTNRDQRNGWLTELVNRHRITGLPSRLDIAEVIKAVDAAIDETTHFQIYWRTASGFAHGRQWAIVNALVRSELTTLRPGVAAVRVGSTLDHVLWGAAAAYELTDRATKLYFEACQPPVRT